MSRLEELIQELCPNGVEYKPLSDKTLFAFRYGKGNKIPEDTGGQYDVYGANGIVSHIDEYNCEDVTIIGHIGAVGLINRVKGKCFVTYNGTIATVVDKEKVDSQYLYYVLTTLGLPSRKKGSQPFLSVSDFDKIAIPVPPLEVQREIVRILDSFTLLTTELKAELTARKKQYEYYRDELLEALHTEGVEYKKLGDIGQVKMCKRILKSQTNTIGEIPFYKIGTFGGEANSFISKGLYEEYKEKYSYPKIGEILISAAGTIGRTVVYDGEPAYYQDSNIVWLSHNESDVLNTFLRYCYELKPWSISSGGTIPRLYNDNILKAKIPVPPIEVQREIVRILDSFTELTGDLTAELTARQKQYEFYRDKLLSFKQL